MSNQKITIEIPTGKKAEWVNGVLTLVDAVPEKPKDVTERIKTFEDALNELGSDNEFVLQYEQIAQNWEKNDESRDFIAYFKLRIICAALNEGWQPQFIEDEYRYFPWFYIYTKEEMDNMSEEERSRVVGRSSHYANANGGLVFANANNASSNSYSYYGSRLAFKSEELAVYCGKQFIEIWADYIC